MTHDASDSPVMPTRLRAIAARAARLAAFVPVPLLNRVLARLVAGIAARRPDIFNRLDGHHHKLFVIDPLDAPFALCLRPDPRRPVLTACRKTRLPQAHCRIAGSFLTLLGMIDGRLDGDALFFTRGLRVEGDTEAVVCLRNALDDVEGSVADDVAAFFGPPGRFGLRLARRGASHVV